MTHNHPSAATGLLDRGSERDVLHGMVAGVRAGQSGVLVLRGEAGIGKTALLEQMAAAAEGCQIARVAGVESEMELAFAGLHTLCGPMLGGLARLPSPQHEALSTALGMAAGPPPDRFLVGLAVLSLLADGAEMQPVLCLVDDVQWLDRVSTQTLAFVARRLFAERVGFVFALRGYDDANELEGLPELVVEGLPPADAGVLLDTTLPGLRDATVRDRILGEAGGNPLALLELPRGLMSTAETATYGFAAEMTLTSRIEQGFVRQMESFSADTRLLLLLTAAEPVGDVTLLWRAATLLGIGPDAAAPAEAAGLVEIGARARFRHPLVRSAAYREAPAPLRREVHRALAAATDALVDPDRRAWHRALAAHGPDEAVADELEQSADRAQARGGLLAAAAFLQRAAELTPDSAKRVERSLVAAQAKLDVADVRSAAELLAAAELGPLDNLQRARLDRLGAQIVFARQRGRDAPPMLLEAARRLDSLDAGMARATYLEAMASAMFAGRLSLGADERQVAAAAQASGRVQHPGPADVLLDALVTRFTEGYVAAVEPLSRALRAFCGPDGGGSDRQWLWLACRLAQDLWDDELWRELATGAVRVARDTGALQLLPNALNHLAAFNIHSGAFATAAELIDEIDAIAQATQLPPLKYSAVWLVAVRGDEAPPAHSLMEWGWRDMNKRGEGSAVGMMWRIRAMRHNAYGRYSEALAAARQACEREEIPAYGWALVELVEAGVRSGSSNEAVAALDRLSERTQASGSEWALGIEARCRGLVGDDESLYQESVERLARSHAAVELARSRLLYGEWLRRENRRVDAREQLRTSHEMFVRMGAQAFADRARRELLATGETVRKRAIESSAELTAQEAEVARLAREGYTNPEIGAQLFLSPRTVEYHLRKVFVKLGISSRKELRTTIPRVWQDP
jgi:DNA-binding CsgD family transcriptional regulator